MWSLILLLFSSVVITAVLAKSNPKWNRATIALTLLMVVVVAFQILKPGAGKPSIAYSTRWDEAIGYQLGASLSRDGINRGTVLILDAVFENAQYPLADIHFKAFQNGLTSQDLNLVRLNAEDLGPLTELEETNIPEQIAQAGPPDISLPLLLKTINQQEEVVALVSFVGLPAAMSDRELMQLPPLYIFGLSENTTPHTDEDLLRASPIRSIIRKKTGKGFPKTPKNENLDAIFSEGFVLKRKQ